MLERPSEPFPSRPGCYLFRDARGRPLYVGKARNLRARLASYFQEKVSDKVARLRRQAASVETVVTASEWEAFLLENNLIKQFRPRFNTLLKDDKTYPFLKLTVREPFPKALFTRRVERDGSLYFGPFVPGWQARRNLKLLQQHFKIATCRDPLDGSRPRPCLYYEMGQCFAPCVKGKVSPSDYAAAVEAARLFLEGKDRALRENLKARMEEAARRQDYETAAHYRDLLKATAFLSNRQAVTRPGEGHWELFALYGGGGSFFLHSFTLVDGKVVDQRHWTLDALEEKEEEVFSAALLRLYGNAPAIPDGICLSRDLPDRPLLERFLGERKGRKVPVRVPKRGPKADLVATLLENARLAFQSGGDPSASLRELQQVLGLPSPPHRMEAFDISHFQGGETTASSVVFEEGRPRKEAYRRYRVRTVAGVDDFASLAEAAVRRYQRLSKAGEPLPDLVLIDGGRGQMAAVHRALERILPAVPPLVGLAKREEQLYRWPDPEPLVLSRASPALHLLMALRDEAHRFAVAGHRARRSRTRLESPLLALPGVGPKTAARLLRAFLTTDAVRKATVEELQRVVGRAAALRIRAALEAPPADRREA
ncbi:MAG: excinuclease ABC subunit UvrC [Acidobacteriota bacterium]